MKSKIMIDLDEDNQPIIKIDYFYSEDVRDKMVKRFLETFGGDSSLAKFQYTRTGNDNPHTLTVTTVTLRPIHPNNLLRELKTAITNEEYRLNPTLGNLENTKANSTLIELREE